MVINGNGKTHWTFAEWLAITGIKRSTAFSYWRQGIGVPRKKIGKHVFISIEDAEAWAEGFGDGLKVAGGAK